MTEREEVFETPAKVGGGCNLTHTPDEEDSKRDHDSQPNAADTRRRWRSEAHNALDLLLLVVGSSGYDALSQTLGYGDPRLPSADFPTLACPLDSPRRTDFGSRTSTATGCICTTAEPSIRQRHTFGSLGW